MKLDRKETLGGLARTRPALGPSGDLPQMQHFWVGKTAVRAYNGALGISVDLKLGLEGGLPGNTLMGLLNSSSADTVNVAVKDDVVSLGIGRAKAKLPLLPADADPWAFPAKMATDAWQIVLTEEFITALDYVMQVEADKPTKTEHRGVMLYPVKKKKLLQLFAVHDTAIARAEVKGGLPDDKPVLMPRKFLTEVVKQMEPDSVLYLLPDYVIAKSPTVTIYGHLLEAEGVLNLDEVLSPYMASAELVQIPDELDWALKRAMIVANNEVPLVRLTADAGKLTVNGKYGLGDFEETMKIDEKCVGEMVINAADVLKLLPSVDSMAVSDQDALVLTASDRLVYVLAGAGE